MSTGPTLHRRIAELASDAGATAVAAAFHDEHHHTTWGYQAGRWFHAASTIKVPVLLGVFDAIDRGCLGVGSRVHVRNRFLSVADDRPYRVDASRDSNAEVHAAVGRTMKVGELARHMIITSSNLATNLLVELVGLDAIQGTLSRLGVDGIELRRGVEDLRAWEEGVNNRVTAEGLVSALRLLLEPDHFSPELRSEMLDILHGQQFRSGIPAGLPDRARVANKTGEISTAAHDAGIVFLPDREPYVLAVLTEWEGEGSGRRELIADVSRQVYEHLTEGEDEGEGGEGEGEA